MTRLKEVMKQRSVTAGQLSAATGVPKRTIQKYVAGYTPINGASFSTGLSIAAALEVEAQRLLEK